MAEEKQYLIISGGHYYCCEEEDLLVPDVPSVKQNDEVKFKHNAKTREGQVLLIGDDEETLQNHIKMLRAERKLRRQSSSFHDDKPRKAAKRQREIMEQMVKKCKPKAEHKVTQANGKKEKQRKMAQLQAQEALGDDLSPSSCEAAKSSANENTEGAKAQGGKKVHELSDTSSGEDTEPVSSSETNDSDLSIAEASVLVKAKGKKADLKVLKDLGNVENKHTKTGKKNGNDQINRDGTMENKKNGSVQINTGMVNKDGSILKYMVNRDKVKVHLKDEIKNIYEEKTETRDVEKTETQDVEEKIETKDVEKKIETQDVEKKTETKDVEEKTETKDVEEKTETKDVEKTETKDVEKTDSQRKESNQGKKKTKKIPVDSSSDSQSDSSVEQPLKKKRKEKVRRNMEIFPGQNYKYMEGDDKVVKLLDGYSVYVNEKDLENAIKVKTSTQFVRNMVELVYTREALLGSTPRGFPPRGKGRNHYKEASAIPPRLHPDGMNAIIDKVRDLEATVNKKKWRPKMSEPYLRQVFATRMCEIKNPR